MWSCSSGKSIKLNAWKADVHCCKTPESEVSTANTAGSPQTYEPIILIIPILFYWFELVHFNGFNVKNLLHTRTRASKSPGCSTKKKKNGGISCISKGRHRHDITLINQTNSILTAAVPCRRQPLRFRVSELLKHICFGLADSSEGRGRVGSVLLIGKNGPQISAQVSPGPPEACLIQLEPRWACAANDLMRERSFFFSFLGQRFTWFITLAHILRGYHLALTV